MWKGILKIYFETDSTARLLKKAIAPIRRISNEIIVSEADPVSSQEITKYLELQSIPYTVGHACLLTTCPKFTRKQLKLKEVDKLFVNAVTGYFVCRSCRKSGPWEKLRDNITVLMNSDPELVHKMCCFDSVDVDKVPDYKQQVQNLLDSCTKTQLTDQQYESLMEHLGWQGIKQSTLADYRVAILEEHDGVVIPLFSSDLSYNSAKLIRAADGNMTTASIPKNNNDLFGWHIARDRRNVVITSSEADAMAVYQQTGTAAISLPRGSSVLPQEALPYLESFSKIILWFENDMLSFGKAKMFAKKLGLKRTLLVRPEAGNPSPYKALKSGLNLPKIIASSSSIQHTHIVQFASHREDVRNELLHATQVAGVQWKNFHKLNEVLKGHRRGELTVFTGGTGTGKTTFISDYSLDLCTSGVNTLWGSFEINNVRLIKMMLQQFAKKNLSKHINEFDHHADLFEQLPMFFMNFHGQESVKKVIETMSHAVYVYDIIHIVVDNLQFMMGTMEDQHDRFHRQDIIVGAFRKFATTMNCHVTLVIHPRKESSEELSINSIFGGAKASQEADNIIILQRVGAGIHTRKYLQVTKNRFDGQLGSMALRFDKESLSFSSKSSGRKTAANDAARETEPVAADDANDSPAW